MAFGRGPKPPTVEIEGATVGLAWISGDFDEAEQLARSEADHTVWMYDEFKHLKRLARPRPTEAIATIKRIFPGSYVIDAWRVGDTARPSRGFAREAPPPEFIEDED